MKKFFRKAVHIILIVSILLGLAMPMITQAEYDTFDDYDFVALVSDVIPGRQIARNSYNNGANTMAYRLYDSLYWGENAIIYADLPASGKLQIAVYNYSDIPGLNPLWQNKSYTDGVSDPFEPLTLPYNGFTPSDKWFDNKGWFHGVEPNSYLSGALNGEPVVFDQNGVPVQQGTIAIEWSGKLKDEGALDTVSGYLMVFSYVPEKVEGEEDKGINTALTRYLPFQYYHTQNDDMLFIKEELTAAHIQLMLEAYRLVTPTFGHIAEIVPSHQLEKEIDFAWGGVQLLYDDIRIEGPSPLVFQRSFNSLSQYFTRRSNKEDQSYDAAAYRGFGELGWDHNFYYRLEWNMPVGVTGVGRYGQLTLTLPLGAGSVDMRFDEDLGFYRAFSEDGGYAACEYILRPVGQRQELTAPSGGAMILYYMYGEFILENNITGESVLFGMYHEGKNPGMIDHPRYLFLPQKITEADGLPTYIRYNIFPVTGNNYGKALRAEITEVSKSQAKLTFTYGPVRDGYRGITKVVASELRNGQNVISGEVNYKYDFYDEDDSDNAVFEFKVIDPDNVESVFKHYTGMNYYYKNSDGRLEYIRNNLVRIDLIDRSAGGFFVATDAYSYDEDGLLSRHDELPLYAGNSVRSTVYTYNKSTGAMLENKYTGTQYNRLGSKITFYDENFRPVLERMWLDEISNKETDTEYIYDQYGRLSSIIDKRGVMTYSYEDEHFEPAPGENPLSKRVHTVAYPDSTYETILYNKKGQPVYVSSRDHDKYETSGGTVEIGRAIEYEYDSDGRRISETFGKTGIRRFYYESNSLSVTGVGRLLEVREFRNAASAVAERILEYQSDDFGRFTRVTDPIGLHTFYGYDNAGRVSMIDKPSGQKLEYNYSPAGKLLSERYLYGDIYNTAAQGWYTRLYKNDGRGNVIGYTNWHDQKNNEPPVWTNSDFNYYNKIGRIYGDAVVETEYGYNAFGRLISVTTPGNGGSYAGKNTTQYTYGIAEFNENSVLSMTDPMGNVTQFGYDDYGNLQVEIRPNGTVLIANWEEGRLKGYGGGNDNMYSYDPAGRVIAERNSLGEETTYEYDGYGNMIAVTNPDQQSRPPAQRLKTVYEYDWENKLVKITTPQGCVIENEYDKLGRINKATTVLRRPDGTVVRNTVRTEYNQDGQVLEVFNNNVSETLYGYDKAGNLIKITHRGGATEEFTYDGNRNRLTEKDGEGNITTITYDNSDRVIKVEEPMGRITTYEYTGDGNLEKISGPYLQQEQLFEYDKNGNLVASRDQRGNWTRNTYDSINRLTSTADPEGNVTSYSYDRNNNLILMMRPNGGRVAFEYDEAGRMTKQSTLADKDKNTWDEIEYAYDKNGNLTAEKDARGNATKYEYDADNRLITIYPRDYEDMDRVSRISYVYDDAGNLAFMINADGITTYEYDQYNRLIGLTPPELFITGEKIVYQYDGLGRLITEIFPYKKPGSDLYDQISYRYDKNGNLIEVTDARGNYTTYKYDALNRLVLVVDREFQNYSTTYGAHEHEYMINTNPDEGETRVDYDKTGNVIKVTDANGNTTEFTYDGNNRLLTTVDVLKDVRYETVYGYNEVGSLTSVKKPNGGVTTMIYSINDLLVEEIDALENSIYRDYDANGNLISLTDRNGNLTEYGYDKENRLISVLTYMKEGDKVVDVYETQYEYDAMGRIKTMISADMRVTTTGYDKNGRITSEVNPLALLKPEDTLYNRVSYTYDNRDRITRATLEDGTVTDYTYDRNGNVLTRTEGVTADFEGYTTTYTYNNNDQLLTEEDPMEGRTIYTYTNTGKVKTITNAMGATTEYKYDANENVIKVTDPLLSETRYEYDGLNRLISERRYGTSVSDPIQITTYEYDGNGNIKKIGHWQHNGTQEELISLELFTYDANDQVMTYTIADEKGMDGEHATTSYGYDKNGNLTSIMDPMKNERRINYDSLNRATRFINEKGIKEGKGGTVTFEYDAMGRIKRAENEDAAVTEYTYDAKGRVTSIKDALNHFKRFQYDARDRVISETDENGVTRVFEYDSVGNLLSKSTYSWGGSGGPQYGVVFDETEPDYSESFTYDANGNMLTYTNRNGETTVYTYDAMNRVETETNPLGGVVSFGYDANGRIRTVTDENNNTTSYTLDANGNIIQVRTPFTAGDVSNQYYEYDAMNRLVSVRAGTYGALKTLTTYVYDYRGLIKREINGLEAEKKYEHDDNGNLIEVRDEEGRITTYRYNETNLVESIDYGSGKTAQFMYNGTGELERFTDWTGETTYKRDKLNRITEVSDPNSRALVPDGKIQYGYDPVGNTTSIKYPDGRQADYYFNAENRIVRLVDTENGVTRFSYDPEGNLVYTEYPNFETSYNYYDALGRLVQKDDYSPAGLNTSTITYEWDPVGNLLREFELTGVRVTAAMIATGLDGDFCNDVFSDSIALQPYDPSIFRIAIAEAGGNAVTSDLQLRGDMSGEYDVGGHTVQISETIDPLTDERSWECYLAIGPPNITPVANNPWADGRIISAGTSNLGYKAVPDKDFNADVRAERQQIDYNGISEDSVTRRYYYDVRNHMTRSVLPSADTRYQYDRFGNLVNEDSYTSDGNSTITYEYNAINQLVLKTDSIEGETAFTYDKSGNLKLKAAPDMEESFLYDAANRMVSYSNTDGETGGYVYNALSMRMKNSQSTRDSTVTRSYIVDYTNAHDSYRNDLMVSSTGPEKYTQINVYAGPSRLMQVVGDKEGELKLYVHEDIRGSAHRYTREDGTDYAMVEYGAWGETVEIIGESKYITPDYAGRAYDALTGMYYGQARIYDAGNRMWTSLDPARQGANWYSYCEANPVSRIDPSGFIWGWLKKAWNWIKDVGSAIWKGLKWIGNKIIQGVEIAFAWIADGITSIAETIVEYAGKLWKAVKVVVTEVGKVAINLLKKTLDWIAENFVFIVIAVALVVVVVATEGSATPLISSFIGKFVADVGSGYIPSAILQNCMKFVAMAACLLAGDWTELAKAAIDAVISTAITFAKEQVTRIISKIEALSGLVKSLLSMIVELDWQGFVEGIIDKGMDFIMEKIDYVRDLADKAMDFVMNLDIADQLARAGEYVVSFVEKKINAAIDYVTNIIDRGISAIDWVTNKGLDYAINYFVEKGNYVISYAENMINQGVDIVSNIPALAETLLGQGLDIVNNYYGRVQKIISQGYDKAMKTVNRVFGQVQEHLNILTDVIAGRVEAFQSQLPQAATRMAEQAWTRGQQVLVSQWPTIQTTAQQTASRHMQKLGRQMFGRPPFTSPQYALAA